MAERVAEADQVVDQRLLAEVLVGRVLRPAEAAQVRGDRAKASLAERPEQVAPFVPVLRPAVHEHDRAPVLGARDRHVQAQPARAHIAMLHTFDVG
jgi:hypothetical protein